MRRVPGGDPAHRAHRERPLPARRLDADRPPDQGRLPAGGRGVQAVRRPARERDLRRAQPGRQGGAARERARRRADPLRERGRARGARRVGALGEPVRHLGAGGGDPRRAPALDGGAAGAAGGDPCARARARPRRLDRRPARRSRPRRGFDPAIIGGVPAHAELVAEGELRSLNPATLEVVGSVRTTDPTELDEIVARAREAQARWTETSLDVRRRLVLDVARVLLDRMDEVAALVTAETGKPLVESYTAELLVSVENVRWTAANAPRLLRVERAPFRQLYLKHKRGYLVYEPLGVVAVISPWNFPLAIPLTQALAAVAAGNAVVVKPSELTPLSGAWVERAFAEAGAPAGLVQTAQGSGDEVGDALVRAPGIAKVFFTGSTEVGRRIGVACAELLRPVTLEHGGKDPMLVLHA